jgi:hypothetical protein
MFMLLYMGLDYDRQNANRADLLHGGNEKVNEYGWPFHLFDLLPPQDVIDIQINCPRDCSKCF